MAATRNLQAGGMRDRSALAAAHPYPSRRGRGFARGANVVPLRPVRPAPRPVERPAVPALLAQYRTSAVSLSQALTAMAFDVPVDTLRARTRCRARIAFARQVAMYLAHTVFGVSQTHVARGFGRDRTTVMHACALIEDRRDDPRLDRRLAEVEAVLEAARNGMHAFAHALADPVLDAELCLPKSDDGDEA